MDRFPRKERLVCASFGGTLDVDQVDCGGGTSCILSYFKSELRGDDLPRETLARGSSTIVGYCGETLGRFRPLDVLEKLVPPTAFVFDVETCETLYEVDSRGRGNFGVVAVDAGLVAFCHVGGPSDGGDGRCVYVVDARDGETAETLRFAEDGVEPNFDLKCLTCSRRGDLAIAWGGRVYGDGGAVTMIDNVSAGFFGGGGQSSVKAFAAGTTTTSEWGSVVIDVLFSDDSELLVVRDPHAFTILDYSTKKVTKTILYKATSCSYTTLFAGGFVLSHDKTLLAETHGEGGNETHGHGNDEDILTVYDVDSCAQLFRVAGDGGCAFAPLSATENVQLAFSTDDQIIAISGGTFISAEGAPLFYDARTGARRRCFHHQGRRGASAGCLAYVEMSSLRTSGPWSSPATHRKEDETSVTAPCKFFFSKGGCKYGADCRFSHYSPSPPSNESPQLEGTYTYS